MCSPIWTGAFISNFSIPMPGTESFIPYSSSLHWDQRIICCIKKFLRKKKTVLVTGVMQTQQHGFSFSWECLFSWHTGLVPVPQLLCGQRFDSLFQHPFYLINNSFHNWNGWFWCPAGENFAPPPAVFTRAASLQASTLKLLMSSIVPALLFLFILWILLPYAFLSLFHTVPLTSTYSFVNSVSFTVQLKHSLFEKVLEFFFLFVVF